MKGNKRVNKLLEDIKRSQEILARNHAYYEKFKTKELSKHGKNKMTAIVLAEILANFYESLEAMFLKISSFFENDLDKGKWHKQLLDNMTIWIENIRERVISKKTHSILEKFLKFRHFKRYHYELNYKWNKLEKIDKKYSDLQPLFKKDIENFINFLNLLR